MNPHLNAHLNNDELIALLYGIGGAAGHLAGCAECSARLSAMRRVRAESTSANEISGRALALQRQQIMERLERPYFGRRWTSAAATVALLAVALFLSRSSFIRPAQPVNAEADAELFTDVYSMERDVEPRAAAPIRAMFQETSFEPSAAGEEPQNQ